MSYGGMQTSSRNHFREPPSMIGQAIGYGRATFQRLGVKPRGRWSPSRLVTVISIIWLYTVYWAERTIFQSSVDQCQWKQWESWPEHATPHHLIFVADPQLVDPHTYPGRPWPLSTLTIRYTDLYLRRSFSLLRKDLYPDTVFFLGDLFDGGREWSTRSTKSEDPQWRGYGEDFWLREYNRFGRIFFKHWGDDGGVARAGQPGRKIIATLPGNHDLGFATGVQYSVRKRFNTYFGEGNRVDIIGNHTFVSIDSVSLSALGDSSSSDEDIWRPTHEFLENAKVLKKRAVTQWLRRQRGMNPNPLYRHLLVETEELAQDLLPNLEERITEFPTILLTHVPLYRAPGTPCGPLREHWPPTPPPKGQTEPLESDERNAIAIRRGYQYQNVLTDEISKNVIEKIGDVSHVFSGDDHDYCEVVHRRYPSTGGGIREITVKSLSWAMGVRRPGFVMLSLWNPVDEHGNPLEKGKASENSVQSHLCLMPDQLGLFIRYAILFVFTLAALGVRALLVVAGVLASRVNAALENPLLPISENVSSAEYEKADLQQSRSGSDDDGPFVSSNRSVHNLRASATRTRAGSGSYGHPSSQSRFPTPLIQHAGYFGPAEGIREAEQWPRVKSRPRPRPRKLTGMALTYAELKWGLFRVGAIVLPWYFWLIWRG